MTRRGHPPPPEGSPRRKCAESISCCFVLEFGSRARRRRRKPLAPVWRRAELGGEGGRGSGVPRPRAHTLGGWSRSPAAQRSLSPWRAEDIRLRDFRVLSFRVGLGVGQGPHLDLVPELRALSLPQDGVSPTPSSRVAGAAGPPGSRPVLQELVWKEQGVTSPGACDALGLSFVSRRQDVAASEGARG